VIFVQAVSFTDKLLPKSTYVTFFDTIGNEYNFIFAIPQGLGFLPGWSIGLSFGGNADDLGFSSSLIDAIATNYSIIEERVYAAGFSNGGFFSYRLGN